MKLGNRFFGIVFGIWMIGLVLATIGYRWMYRNDFPTPTLPNMTKPAEVESETPTAKDSADKKAAIKTESKTSKVSP